MSLRLRHETQEEVRRLGQRSQRERVPGGMGVITRTLSLIGAWFSASLVLNLRFARWFIIEA